MAGSAGASQGQGGALEPAGADAGTHLPRAHGPPLALDPAGGGHQARTLLFYNFFRPVCFSFTKVVFQDLCIASRMPARPKLFPQSCWLPPAACLMEGGQPESATQGVADG